MMKSDIYIHKTRYLDKLYNLSKDSLRKVKPTAPNQLQTIRRKVTRTIFLNCFNNVICLLLYIFYRKTRVEETVISIKIFVLLIFVIFFEIIEFRIKTFLLCVDFS